MNPLGAADLTVFTAQITDLGTSVRELGTRVFEKLDGISSEQSKLSERMARVETWGYDQKESQRRWWDKTWPDHLTSLNDALREHGRRIETLEKGQAALEKITTLEGDLREQKKAIARMTLFQTKIKVYVAIVSIASGAIGTGLLELALKHFFH
jgi:predicted RNase H-like nuclease (RuvC/YqgF family)